MRLLKKIRIKAGRKPTPTYGIIDSKSVKTMYASDERGFDGGKRVKGRKRHAVTDTMGNLLAVKVHAANIHDTVTGEAVFRAAYAKYPSIKGCAADAGYRKTFVNALKKLACPLALPKGLCLRFGLFCLYGGLWSVLLAGHAILADCLKILRFHAYLPGICLCFAYSCFAAAFLRVSSNISELKL